MNALTKTDVIVEWYKTNKVVSLQQYIKDNFIPVHFVNENSFISYLIGYDRIEQGVA